MKKYQSIFIAAITVACVTSTFGQGTVVFNNGTGLVWQPTFSGEIPMPVGGGRVQLFWAPTGTAYTPWTFSLTPAQWFAANPGWSLGPVIGFTTPSAGKFNGGTVTLSALDRGGNIDYAIIGWTGSAQSLDAALASSSSNVGVSSRFTSATGDPTRVPPGTPVPLAASFGGLHISYIPEPSSLALVGLGAATLLALRRRT
jgi:hypothetical protein